MKGELAAALEINETRGLSLLEPDAWVIIRAARERLRLEKQPCGTCGGDGLPRCAHKQTQMHTHSEWACAGPVGLVCVCGGSGEVWPAELVKLVSGVRPFSAPYILDAISDYLTEGK